MHEDDPEVVAAILAGDLEKFHFLVERHQENLFQYIQSRVQDYHEAEDLTVLTFGEAYRSLSSFRFDRDSFRGWLFGIAGNLCTDWRRDRRNRNSSLKLNLFGDLDSQPDSIAADEERKDDDERTDALKRVMAQLPARFREVLTLWGVLGLTMAETARALSISEPAARKRLSRARAELRRRLS